MSLTLATLLPGILLFLVGVLLFSRNSLVVSASRAMPRSRAATVVLFGGAAVWFLTRVWTLSMADFGEYRTALLIFFALLALLAFSQVPDFLAVRGLAALMLLAATPLLDAAYMEYHHPQRLFMVSAVYVGIALAIYLGAVPFRLRDFIDWLFATAERPRVIGAALAVYGLVLGVVAFTY